MLAEKLCVQVSFIEPIAYLFSPDLVVTEIRICSGFIRSFKDCPV